MAHVSKSIPPKLILIIEDDPEAASYLQKALHEAGHVAEVARDAAAAIVERLGGRPADPSSIAAAVKSIKSLSGAA